MSEDDKYIKMICKLKAIEMVPNTVKWAALVRHLLISMAFYKVWMQQGVHYLNREILNARLFLSLVYCSFQHLCHHMHDLLCPHGL